MQDLPYESLSWSDVGTYSKTEQFDRYDGMLESFAAMVRGEKKNPYMYDYELELFRHILLACGAKDVTRSNWKQ